MSNTLLDAGTIELDFSKNKVQQAFMACTARFQLFSGGFGSGKTTACNAKGLLLSAMIPNNFGVVCRETYPDLRDTTRKSFFDILPPDWIKGWKESENALTLKNNSVVIFRYFENGKVKVGSSLGWFFIDQAEEATKEIFVNLMGRLRRQVPRRYGLLAMNPNGEDWQHSMFRSKDRTPGFECFDSSSYDNQANLPKGYIEDMVAHFPAEWIERFVLGKWNKMSGLIFHELADRHFIEPFAIPSDWVKIRGMDWGVDAPATCRFITQSPKTKKYYVFDEYGDREKTPEEHADAIKEKSKVYGAFRANVLDSSAFHRESDLKSVADRYYAKGLSCQPGTKDLLARILFVKHLLKTDQLYFFDGKTDQGKEEYKKWKWGPKVNGREVPSKGNDHYIDADGYAIYWMHRKGFYPQAEAPQNLRQREEGSGVLNRQEPSLCDAVTGLPA